MFRIRGETDRPYRYVRSNTAQRCERRNSGRWMDHAVHISIGNQRDEGRHHDQPWRPLLKSVAEWIGLPRCVLRAQDGVHCGSNESRPILGGRAAVDKIEDDQEKDKSTHARGTLKRCATEPAISGRILD